MNFRSATASFTVSDEPWASLSCANLPTDSAFYDVSVRRLTALLQTSFRPRLATTPLSFASSYSILEKYTGVQLQRTCTSLVHAHAGRTSGKGGFFSRPPHTTGHAGPHPAVHRRMNQHQMRRSSSHLQGWRLSPRRSRLSPVGHKCRKASVTVLLLDRDVRPFTMSQQLN